MSRFLQSDLNISQGKFISLESPEDYSYFPTLWNVPNPPAPDSLRQPLVGLRPPRLNSVALDCDVTGISIFGSATEIFGLHIHTRTQPSAIPAWRKVYHQIETSPLGWDALDWGAKLQWRYFPLGEGETIVAAWCLPDGFFLFGVLELVVRVFIPFRVC